MGKQGATVSVKGGRGNDTLQIPNGTLVTKATVDGGQGSDTLNLSSYGSGVSISITTVASSVSRVSERDFTGVYPSYLIIDDSAHVSGTIRNVENLIGTEFNDYLWARIPTGSTFVDGRGGNDTVQVHAASSIGVGGAGSDWLVGYGTNITLVGGTYSGGVATADGTCDYFYLGSPNITILDFEVGTDRLICELTNATTGTGTWASNGSGGSTLSFNGIAEVTLANVPLALAETIDLGFAVLPENPGSPGNDIWFMGAHNTLHLGADNGDDLAISFDVLTDTIVFEDGFVPTWSDTLVNGAPALLGTWADGSITLMGLDTSDLANMNIQGAAPPPTVGAPGPGPWSTSTDADFAATVLLAG